MKRNFCGGFGLVLVAGIGLVAGPVPLHAQFFEFGQNKIQYRIFDWQVLRGPHVDLYYYPAEAELAHSALAWAEASYDSLALEFGHVVSARVPLIVYASHVDFEQTNVLPFVPPEGLLGATDFLKRRVTMPFRGNFSEFRHTLRHELVHVFQLDLMAKAYYEAPRMQQLSLPLWWTEGLAEHWSGGQEARDEMILRDLTLTGRLPTLAQLQHYGGFLVYPVGGSIHKWLGETYGDWRVMQLYRELNRHFTFDDALRAIYGRSQEELSEEWVHAMRQRYYPEVTRQSPPSLLGTEVARLAIKPAFRGGSMANDSLGEALFISPDMGYMAIYRRQLDGRRGRREVLSAGKSESLESMHPFDSRMDASRPGLLLFTARHGERDALIIWDLDEDEMVGRYQFPGLVSILSPAWLGGSGSVVFSGLADNGVSDLYQLDLPGGDLTRLTSDLYQDLDPAPSADGRLIAFASDRAPGGERGAINLMLLDRDSGRIRPLTSGFWRDESPAFGPDGRIYHGSSRSGMLNVWSVDTAGNGRRETSTWSAAFDPVPLPDGSLMAGSFQNGSYNIYRLAPDTVARADRFTLSDPGQLAAWRWMADTTAPPLDSVTNPYQRRFTLDFAAGGVAVTPGQGGVQGGAFLMSDLLGDHTLIGTIGSFQDRNFRGNFFSNLSGSLTYINRQRRVNWGVGAFRFVGQVFQGDRFASYEERASGATALIRYPLSRYNRVEGSLTVARSDRFDFDLPVDEPRRVGWIASNYVSFVRDNSLWIASGPIDGFRLGLTAGVASDFTNSRFDNYVLSADLRRYFRLGRRSAYATRLYGLWGSGDRPPMRNIGGTTGLRGYPNFGHIIGTRAWMVNQEVRFPLFNRLILGTPLGDIVFPEFQGAIFADYGRAWIGSNSSRRPLGSAGGSVRLAIAPLAVVRFDAGVRFGGNDRQGYDLDDRQRDGGFFSFFFGYNY